MTESRRFLTDDGNISELRQKWPEGLNFVVGDTHGDSLTLSRLMEHIAFDPAKDHVWFVGDYNAGGNVTALLRYMAQFYQPDPGLPGFHMIRGNHERELSPVHRLENLPDVYVIRGREMNYYIIHAGMVSAAFDLINEDIASEPGRKVFAYAFEDSCVSFDAPLRNVIWSRRGLYSLDPGRNWWPPADSLYGNGACIIHGHSPYCFFVRPERSSYGDRNLFWEKQHVFFSEDLHSFNIDSDIKGRNVNGETYRGLACVCLEVCEEIAKENSGRVTIEGILKAPNFVFSEPKDYSGGYTSGEDILKITRARPEMKLIRLAGNGRVFISR